MGVVIPLGLLITRIAIDRIERQASNRFDVQGKPATEVVLQERAGVATWTQTVSQPMPIDGSAQSLDPFPARIGIELLEVTRDAIGLDGQDLYGVVRLGAAHTTARARTDLALNAHHVALELGSRLGGSGGRALRSRGLLTWGRTAFHAAECTRVA